MPTYNMECPECGESISTELLSHFYISTKSWAAKCPHCRTELVALEERIIVVYLKETEDEMYGL